MKTLGHSTHIFDNVTPDAVRRTVAGMAHWAGTGPQGKTCRQCVHWTGGKYRYGPHSGNHQPYELKPGKCGQYKRLTGRQVKAEKIAHSTRACRHFAENANPPPITRAVLVLGGPQW